MNENKGDTRTAMMSREQEAAVLEKVIVGGDLSKLTPMERVMFYRATCESVGLNPLTRPLEFIYLQNKLVLYARKEATEQLRNLKGVSITKLETKTVTLDNEDMYVVIAFAADAKGRSDASTGAVTLSGLHGEQRANAMRKAETKAKRRVTLSLCGLGVLDESEGEIPAGAQRVTEVAQAGLYVRDNERGDQKIVQEETTTTLFPYPEQDRAGLIQRARMGAARLDKKRVGELKSDLFGSEEAKYETVDLAALV